MPLFRIAVHEGNMNVIYALVASLVVYTTWYVGFDDRYGCDEPGVFQICESDGDAK